MQILKKEIKQRIQQKAVAEFLRYGYEEASMRNIAKASAVSVGNLYNYYKNKEDLFYSLTKTSYHYLETLLKEVQNHGPAGKITNREFTKSLVMKISELVKKHRVGFLLMIEKGAGTKYKDLKDELILLLLEHFEEELVEKKKSNNYLIMKIAATNLIYGLIEIARNYQSDNLVDSNIDRLINYHLHGIAQFYV